MIKITRLEVKSMIALDMNNLVKNHKDVSLLTHGIQLSEPLELAGFIHMIETKTPRTWGLDRLERHTMSHRIIDQLPKGAELTTPLSQRVSRSNVEISKITITESGILVIEGKTRICVKMGIGIADAVEELRVARRTVDTLSETIFREAAKILQPDKNISSDEIIRGLVEDRSGRFEIYDFDAHLKDNSNASWEELFQTHAAQQELVGLIRLSRPGVWSNYGKDFCNDFLSRVDLGKRTDDFWAVYSRRLFRRHPEAVERQDVQNYFDDVGIIAAVLLASEASLETVAEQFTAFSLTALKRIGSGGRNTNKVNTHLVKAVQILPAVISPSRIHEHFEHQFFQELSGAIESTMDIIGLRNSVQQQVVNFLGAASAVAANTISTESLRSTKRVEWLTVATAILAIAVFILSLIQVLKLNEGGTP